MKFTLLSHFFNEELLLPHWIAHHLPLVERAILIDHDSTDRSADIVRSMAPHWEIRKTRCADFNVRHVDAEMQGVERGVDGWKIILNTTEFFVWGANQQANAMFIAPLALGYAWGQPMALIDPIPRSADAGGFVQTHRWGYQEGGFRARLLHSMPCGEYELGRHASRAVPHNVTTAFYVAWAQFAPWPEAVPRKLQIQQRIPECDRRDRLGWQHIQDPSGLDALYRGELAKSYDLFERHPDYAMAVRSMAG